MWGGGVVATMWNGDTVRMKELPPDKPTAKSYVQDGLIAMWDGIENAGWGLHDPSATVWKDLIGGYTCPILSNVSVLADCLATASSLNLSAQKLKVPQALASGINSGVLTVEFVGLLRCSGTNSDGIAAIFANSSVRPLTMYAVQGDSGKYRRFRGSLLATSGTAAGANYNIAVRSNVQRFSMAVVFNAGTLTQYQNGTFLGSFAYTPSQSAAATTNMDLTLMYSQSGGNHFDGEMCGLRFSSRALTAEEIAHNYAIDKERFGLT